MSDEQRLIDLFLGQNLFSCFILTQEGECGACERRAKKLAQDVIDMMGT